KKVAAAAAVASTLALLTGCGKGPENNAPVAAVPPAAAAAYAGGCVPIATAQSIAFNAINASYTGNYLLKAGALPQDNFAFQYAPETIGTVTVGGVAAPIPPSYGALTLSGYSRYNGTTFQATITPTTGAAPQPTP